MFGYSNYEYTLLTLYQDLSNIRHAQLTHAMESMLPQVYWLILNCTDVEKNNLTLSSITWLKFQNQFGISDLFYLMKDLWLLLRCIDNNDERRNTLEASLLILSSELLQVKNLN